MKITKKILAVAVAVAGLSLMGCPMPLGDGLISSTGQVDYTNENETEYARDFSQLPAKHEDFAVKITLENAKDSPGVMGAAFDMTQNDDGSWNFGVVGIQCYGGAKKYYVSHFFNTKKEDWNSNNFGVSAKKSGFDSSVDTPYEIVLKDFTVLPSNAYTYSDEEGLSCVVLIQTTNQCGYNINIVKPEAWENATGTTAAKFTSLVSDSSKLSSLTNTHTGYTYDAENDKWLNPAGKESNIVAAEPGHIEAKVGYYVNIYGQKTMKGSFDKVYTKGEPIAE
ncbi:MAG: hypothetical protein IKX23_09400 [Treponema sp.]|nr:hypothetical protein [Treponema sp.]